MMLQLIKDRISEFVIDGHRFVKRDSKENESNGTDGFFEVIMENPFFTALKKHKKVKHPVYKKNKVFSKFVGDEEYFIDFENQFLPNQQ